MTGKLIPIHSQGMPKTSVRARQIDAAILRLRELSQNAMDNRVFDRADRLQTSGGRDYLRIALNGRLPNAQAKRLLEGRVPELTRLTVRYNEASDRQVKLWSLRSLPWVDKVEDKGGSIAVTYSSLVPEKVLEEQRKFGLMPAMFDGVPVEVVVKAK